MMCCSGACIAAGSADSGRSGNHPTAGFRLNGARLDRSTRRMDFVLLKHFRSACEDIVVDQGGHGDFDPIATRFFMMGTIARADPAALAQRACDPLAGFGLGLAEACGPLVRRVSQHGPHCGSLPARRLLACRHALLIEEACNSTNTQSLTDIVVVDHADDISFGLDDFVIGRRIIAPADVTIAIRRPAEHADLTLMGTMTLAAARAFQDCARSYSAIMPWNCTSS